jgi:hypothetical protein
MCFIRPKGQSAEPFSAANASMTAEEYFGLERREYQNSMNSRGGPFTGDFSR